MILSKSIHSLFGVCFIFASINFAYCQWGWRLPFPYGCVERPVQAICRFRPNRNVPQYSNITGIAILTQRISCRIHYALQMKISINGLPADGNWTYHGLHIHRSGDMSDGCESMREHYNPNNAPHGSKASRPYARHVGDLGNVAKDPFGNIQGAIFDDLASLVGRHTVLFRGIILHEKEDDLGLGDNAESRRTGNAGRRLACCLIMPL